LSIPPNRDSDGDGHTAGGGSEYSLFGISEYSGGSNSHGGGVIRYTHSPVLYHMMQHEALTEIGEAELLI